MSACYRSPGLCAGVSLFLESVPYSVIPAPCPSFPPPFRHSSESGNPDSGSTAGMTVFRRAQHPQGVSPPKSRFRGILRQPARQARPHLVDKQLHVSEVVLDDITQNGVVDLLVSVYEDITQACHRLHPW